MLREKLERGKARVYLALQRGFTPPVGHKENKTPVVTTTQKLLRNLAGPAIVHGGLYPAPLHEPCHKAVDEDLYVWVWRGLSGLFMRFWRLVATYFFRST